jgi:hypothetical protein
MIKLNYTSSIKTQNLNVFLIRICEIENMEDESRGLEFCIRVSYSTPLNFYLYMGACGSLSNNRKYRINN